MDYIHFRNALAVLLFLSSKKKDREKGKELNCFPSIFPTWANSYELTVGVQQIPVEMELHIYFGQSDFPPTCLNSELASNTLPCKTWHHNFSRTENMASQIHKQKLKNSECLTSFDLNSRDGFLKQEFSLNKERNKIAGPERNTN